MSEFAEDTRAITNLAIGAVIGYALWYFFFNKNPNSPAGLENQAVTSLANWYVNLTSQGAQVPQGTILLPNGSTVPVSQVNVTAVNANTASGIAGTFSFNGSQYYLPTGADSNGNYAAVSSLSGSS